MLVSLDGPKEYNDNMRIHPDGSGTYEEIINGINILNRHGVKYMIRGTFTNRIPNLISRLVENLNL